MDDRIVRTQARVQRLVAWAAWTRYRETAELAILVALQSLNASQALRETVSRTALGCGDRRQRNGR